MQPPRRKRAFSLPASRSRIDADLRAEFQFHIDERIEQFMADGMSREDAVREVTRRFGDYDTHRSHTTQIDEETMQQRRRSERLRDFQRELRFALRSLWRSPGFTIIAFLTLTLGVGATTGIFSVLDAVVLRPLPYRDAGALVSVLHPATVPGSGERSWGVSAGGYFQFAEKNQSFSTFGLYRNSGLTVTNDNQAEVVRTALVTASMFPVLAARPFAGRLLTADDDKPGAPLVTVISHEFLQRRFGGSLAVLNTVLETSDGPFQIVGVAEPGLALPLPGPFASSADLNGFGVDVWLPMQLNPAGPFHNSHPQVGVGRLKPGVSIERAQRDLQSVFAHFTETLPTVYGPRFMKSYNFRLKVESLQRTVLGPQLPRTLWMLFGAVVLVFGIAASNVANLYLVRLNMRRQESAVRTALGASRTQMAIHHLAETLLLCGAAALAGLALAAAGIRAMLLIAPTDVPRLASVSLDARAAALALALSLCLGVILGLLPPIRRGIDVNALRSGTRELSASLRQRIVRNGLVVGQLAMALTLLTAAGLMLRSFGELRNVNPGFDTSNLLVFDISLPYNEYSKRASAITFHRELQRRLRELPGVTDVGSIGAIPLEGYGTGCTVVFREGGPYGPAEQTPCVSTPSATPGAFDALGMTVEGRTPTWADVTSLSQAVVVTKALADRLWPGESAIGKGIGSNGPDSKVWYRVVGVARNIKAEALDAPDTEAVFYATTALRPDWGDGELNDHAYLVRTNGTDPMQLIPEVRRTVSEMSSHVPIIAPRSLDTILARSMARTTFLMVLLSVAALVALLLSAIGVYGVIAYVVTQRRTEIGIRIALGASIRQVVNMVMLQAVRLVVIGVGVGLVGALLLSRVMRSVLFGVSATDPTVLGGVVVVLLITTVVASVVPARRAARVDPSEAMRAG